MHRMVNFFLVPLIAFYALAPNYFSTIGHGPQDVGHTTDGSATVSRNFSLAQNPFRYSSYYQDVESKLCYLKARYFSPKLARFVSRDTYSLPNRYAYCDGDPINNIDPNGHSPIDLVSLALAGDSLKDIGDWITDKFADPDARPYLIGGAVALIILGGLVAWSLFRCCAVSPSSSLVNSKITTEEILTGHRAKIEKNLGQLSDRLKAVEQELKQRGIDLRKKEDVVEELTGKLDAAKKLGSQVNEELKKLEVQVQLAEEDFKELAPLNPESAEFAMQWTNTVANKIVRRDELRSLQAELPGKISGLSESLDEAKRDYKLLLQQGRELTMEKSSIEQRILQLRREYQGIHNELYK